MNCREFAERWDDLLDARSAPIADLERLLEAHASACTPCQAVSDRYQLLRQAVSILRPPPVPSTSSIERLYALTLPSTPLAIPIRSAQPRLRRLVRVAAAATVFAIAWLGGKWWPSPSPAPRLAVVPGRALGDSLAEATEATIDLAIDVSAPASRIGREVIDLGKTPDQGRPLAPDSVARSEAPLDPASASSGLFQSVGERIEAGVKPISGSARHAFSFLLGQPGGPDPAPPKGRDSL